MNEELVYVVIHSDESNNSHEVKDVRKSLESAKIISEEILEKLVMQDLMETSAASREDYERLKEEILWESDDEWFQYSYGDSDTVTIYKKLLSK